LMVGGNCPVRVRRIARKRHAGQLPHNCLLALTDLFYEFLLASFATNIPVLVG